MKMVAVGLAGASPHMISATVTAISRLIFEFKGKIKLRFSFRYLTHISRFYLGLVARRNLEDNVRIPFVPKSRNCQINSGLRQIGYPYITCRPSAAPSKVSCPRTFDLVA